MLAQRAILGGVNDDAFHQHLSGGVTDRNRDACLMHVYANILSVIHWVLLSVGHEPPPQAYLKGAPFFYNALTAALNWRRVQFLKRPVFQYGEYAISPAVSPRAEG